MIAAFLRPGCYHFDSAGAPKLYHNFVAGVNSRCVKTTQINIYLFVDNGAGFMINWYCGPIVFWFPGLYHSFDLGSSYFLDWKL